MKKFILVLIMLSMNLAVSSFANELTSKSPVVTENVILINPFRVPDGKLKEAVQFWEKAGDFLQTQPGYVSTKLHQAIQPDATYQLINVAEWESVESFTVASKKMRKYLSDNKIRRLKGLVGEPGLYSVIRK